MPTYPGLYVQGFGNVPLPLNEIVAEELIKLCSKSPFGVKYKTVFYSNVRDTYELDPASITIQNSAWDIQL